MQLTLAACWADAACRARLAGAYLFSAGHRFPAGGSGRIGAVKNLQPSAAHGVCTPHRLPAAAALTRALVLGAVLLALALACGLAACRPAPDAEAPDAAGTGAGSGALAAAPAKRAGPELGSAQQPLVMAFVPSTEAEKIVEGAQPLMALLERETGYHFKDYVATSYITVVEALGKGHVHAAWLPTFAYVLAHQRHNAQVALKVVRDGKDTYFGLIITRTDSGVKALEDLKGRTFAFVDANSASGHLYPRALLLRHGIDPEQDLKRYLFAGGHDSVVLAVFKGSVDAGAIYDDAREKFAQTMPQVLAETTVLATTDPIPSDTVTLAGDLPPELARRLTEALLKLVKTEEGRQAMYDIYQVEDLVPAKDSDYDPVREMARVLDLDLERQLREE